MRGEASVANVMARVAKGPSPRARGSPEVETLRDIFDGSIPACAGKPVGASVRRGDERVHPRVRGEALGRIKGK